jgi:hypothetical protein
MAAMYLNLSLPWPSYLLSHLLSVLTKFCQIHSWQKFEYMFLNGSTCKVKTFLNRLFLDLLTTLPQLHRTHRVNGKMILKDEMFRVWEKAVTSCVHSLTIYPQELRNTHGTLQLVFPISGPRFKHRHSLLPWRYLTIIVHLWWQREENIQWYAYSGQCTFSGGGVGTLSLHISNLRLAW